MQRMRNVLGLGLAVAMAGMLAMGCATRSAADRPSAPKPLYDPDEVLAEEARLRAMDPNYVAGQTSRSSAAPRYLHFDRLVNRQPRPKPEPEPETAQTPAQPENQTPEAPAESNPNDSAATGQTGPGGYPPHFPYVDRVRVGNGIYRRIWSGPNTYILDSSPERTATGFQYSATSGVHLWHTRTRGGNNAQTDADRTATYSGTVYPGNQAYGYRR